MVANHRGFAGVDARGSCLGPGALLLPRLLLLLLAVGHLPPTSAGPREELQLGMRLLRETYPNHSWSEPVIVSDEPRGSTDRSEAPVIFRKVLVDQDQAQLYHENLMLDLAPWRERRNLSMAALAKWATGLPTKSSVRLVLLKQGRVALLGQQGAPAVSYECVNPCDRIMKSTLDELRKWVAASPSDWPDVAFVLNVADTSMCQDPGAVQGSKKERSKADYGPCPAPVLSVIKEWDKYKDEDILVPNTLALSSWRNLVYFPYDKKIKRAIFRGRGYCHTKFFWYTKDTCSRAYLAVKSATSPDWQQLIDVGFVANYTARTAEGTVRVRGQGFVATEELARFKYTLALDGITASSRLARLLTINSPVLKQASPWIEWYYRSLVPGVHYISFWNFHRMDIMYVIKHLKHNYLYLQDVARQGQAFAYRYLTPHARMLYWRRVLEEYKALLPDMDAYVKKQALPSGEYVVSRKKEGSKGAAPAAGQGGSDQEGDEGDEAGG